MESALRAALKSEEFVLYYQPQFSLERDRIVGVEALLRWNHSQKGIIAPDSFIAAAEDSALIVPMGEWVLRQACRQG